MREASSLPAECAAAAVANVPSDLLLEAGDTAFGLVHLTSRQAATVASIAAQTLLDLASIALQMLMLVARDHAMLGEASDLPLEAVDPNLQSTRMATPVVILTVAIGISLLLPITLRLRPILCGRGGRDGESRSSGGKSNQCNTHLGSPYERLIRL